MLFDIPVFHIYKKEFIRLVCEDRPSQRIAIFFMI